MIIKAKGGVDYEGARVGMIDACDDGKVFLWVGRKDDSEDDERVAVLDRKEIARLITALTKELAR